MDHIQPKLLNLISQNKYVLLILVLGIALMLLPGKSNQVSDTIEPATATSQTTEERLEQILGQIQGVGRVRVLLTESQGEQVVYVYDEDRSETDINRQAVVITDSDRAQNGLVSQVLPPSYLGAVIVCQGGDLPGVKLAIVEAVCDATGLTADKITVLKMK